MQYSTDGTSGVRRIFSRGGGGGFKIGPKISHRLSHPVNKQGGGGGGGKRTLFFFFFGLEI